jgi:hypothetical protein
MTAFTRGRGVKAASFSNSSTGSNSSSRVPSAHGWLQRDHDPAVGAHAQALLRHRGAQEGCSSRRQSLAAL